MQQAALSLSTAVNPPTPMSGSSLAVENAVLGVPSGLVLTDDAAWYHLGRCAWNLRSPGKNPSCGKYARHMKTILPKPTPTLPINGTLHGSWCLGVWRYANNFYHLLTDLLPYLIDVAPRDRKLLIGAPPTQVESAVFAALSVEVKLLTPGNYCVEQLLIPTNLFPEWNSAKRQAVTQFLDEAFPTPPGWSPKSTRIYVSRRNTKRRHLANERELLPFLKAEGFQCVELERLALAEQIAIFRHASRIFTPHGAALTHLMHLKKGAKILEVRPRIGQGDFCFDQLSASMPITHHVLVPPTRHTFSVTIPELLSVPDFWNN